MTQANPQALNVNINPANSNPNSNLIDKSQAEAEIYAQIDSVRQALCQLEQTVRKVS